MLIIESGHGIERGRESKEDGDLYSIPSQHVFMVFRPKAAQGSCKATAGSLSFSHRGCLAGTPSRVTPSHMTRLSQARP